MKLKHKAIVLASIGFGLGVIICVIISAVIESSRYNDGMLHLCTEEFLESVGSPVIAFCIQAFASGIYGMIAMGGTVVYEIEKWGLAKCSLIHYLTTMIAYYILAFSMRWFSLRDMATILILFAIMTVSYFFIWLCFYLSYRVQLKKINMELEVLKMSEIKTAK